MIRPSKKGVKEEKKSGGGERCQGAELKTAKA